MALSPSSPSIGAPSPLAMDNSSSCSPCTCWSWHQVLPACGVATSIGAVVAALGSAVCFPAIGGPLGIAAAALSGVSCLAHGGSSLSICRLAPLAGLRGTVETAERTANEIALDTQEIATQVIHTQQLTERQAQMLRQEFNQLKEQKASLETANEELRLRNEELNESLRHLNESMNKSQPMVESLSSALGQFKTLVKDFQPKKLTDGIDSFTKKIGQLKLLGSRAEDSKNQTEHYSQAYVNAEQNFQEAMEIITEKLTALGRDNEDLTQQNGHLKLQIDKLTTELQESSTLQAKLEKATKMLKDVTEIAETKSQKVEQLEKANNDLAATNGRYNTLFKRPDIQALINTKL